ncbi:unnamed protein product [Cuscuta campestris]|uniref:Uncharacterized protein n=1 Tax=Cuscuta campestris TaxID=132261 RepID=A0A484KMM2_9ASTE|nr:unnamed protein product [Cuscuta campestris]
MHPQKPVTKQFMSSTKERSVLGERNEANSSHSPIQKPPTHVEKTNLKNSRFQYPNRSSLAVSEPDDDDSSSKQYDPLRSNYCSPRPKYLRYRPNRHRELILNLESRDYGVQRCISAGDGGNGVSEDDATGRDEDETDDEEEEEEEEGYLEDSRQSSNWFLKLLLFTVAVLLSPLFVSLLDNSPSSPAEPVAYGFGEMNNVLWGVSLNGSASEYQNEIEVSPSGITWESDERVEIGDGVEFPVDEEEMFTGTSNMPSEGQEEKLEKETTESVAGEVEEGFDQLPLGNSEDEEGFDQPHSVGEMEEKGGFDLPVQHGALEVTGERLSESKNYASDVIQELVQVEPAAALVESIRETFLEETDSSDDSIDSDDSKDEDTVPGIIYDDFKDEDTFPWRISNDSKNYADVAVKLYSKLQQIMLTPAAITIVSLLPVILAYAYSARQQPRTSHEQSNAVLDPPPQKVKTEKIESNAKASALIDPVEEYRRYTASNLFPPLEHSSIVETEATRGTKKLPGVKNAEDSSFLVGSVKDSVQELSSHNKTLEVELLGEFVIGEASSSLRACVRKPRLLPETEESSYSYSFSQASGGSSKLHHPPMESPTSDSSFGRRFSTTEKKQLPKKKERGNDGEGTKKGVITTTPVRRSSRIRNRGVVMSP